MGSLRASNCDEVAVRGRRALQRRAPAMLLPSIGFFSISLAAGSSTGFHEGYAAGHVTRLYRYDHSGLDSMIAEEEEWHQAGAGSRAAAGTVDAIGDVAPRARQTLQGFVELSRQQLDRLAQHHNEWHAMQSPRPRGIIRRVLRPVFSVMSLVDLNSQYVGPLGVGTVLGPPGCRLPSGRSLLQFRSKAGNFQSQLEASSLLQAFSTKSRNGAPQSSLLQSGSASKGIANGSAVCHAEEQSMVYVVFDTGSTNIWVASDLCRHGPCVKKGRTRYDHGDSLTWGKGDSELTVRFGTGVLSGPQAVEDFHIGPYTVRKQVFAMIADEEGDVFYEVPFDGIMGLAFKNMSARKVTPFFDNVIQQRALEHNEFAFYLSPTNKAANAIFWGGVDPDFYEGPLRYFPVVQEHYWALRLLQFKIGKDVIFGARDVPAVLKGGNSSWVLLEGDDEPEVGAPKGAPFAIVDTGTTYFTADGRVHDEVMRRLKTTPCDNKTDDSHPPITWTLQSSTGEAVPFVFRHHEYMAAVTSKTGDVEVCRPAFMRIPIPKDHGPAMVLGEIFLRHYFSVFNRDVVMGDGRRGAAVALARSRNEPTVHSKLRRLTASQGRFRPRRRG